ncbi:MAG: peptide-methionine (S)-S-oxide reductase MsrA [Bacteroidota bacterium]
MEKATLGAGCFWCVDTLFRRLNGVLEVTSGYMGGARPNPTYEQVCSGATGHAEVVQIEYDEMQISFAEILEVFFAVHDPTTLNRQGADVGTQYRSVIFYHSEEQREIAELAKKSANESGEFENAIVTEISAAQEYYLAEEYHQDYFNLNPNKGYCAIVIQPKLEKFKKIFKEKLK